MGYSDITLYGSDAAADAYSWVSNDFTKAANSAVKKLRKELKDMHNEYNTSGPVNVALILTESEAPLFFASDYPKFLEEAFDALGRYAEVSAEAEWDDSDSKKRHLSSYRALLRKLAKKVLKIRPEDYAKGGLYGTL